MNIRTVEAGNGWQWIVSGFALFRKAPLLWIALTVVLVVIWMVSLMIPLVGPLLFNLFSPVLFAGLMIGARAADRGEALELAHLFAGFQNNAAALVTIGGIYLAGTIVAIGIVFVSAGGAMLPTMMQKSPGDIEMMAGAARSMALALALGLAIYLPLLMLIWFAPLLVVFENQKPVDAMKLSFSALVANWLPFLVYGLAILVLWVIASIPLLLGLIVLMPVLICSVYTSYQDIFGAAPQPAGAAA